MQHYDNPKSRNTTRAAMAGSGALPGKVSVPMPGTNAPSASHGKPGSKAGKAPEGFAGGIIPGKI
jgi:hypothetical protein